MFKLYNYCCAAVFWKLWRRQIAEFPLGLARVDEPNAHELTNHIPHPSPAPCLLSPCAAEKKFRRWYGMVPVSPTGTTASFPRIL